MGAQEASMVSAPQEPNTSAEQGRNGLILVTDKYTELPQQASGSGNDLILVTDQYTELPQQASGSNAQYGQVAVSDLAGQHYENIADL